MVYTNRRCYFRNTAPDDLTQEQALATIQQKLGSIEGILPTKQAVADFVSAMSAKGENSVIQSVINALPSKQDAVMFANDLANKIGISGFNSSLNAKANLTDLNASQSVYNAKEGVSDFNSKIGAKQDSTSFMASIGAKIDTSAFTTLATAKVDNSVFDARKTAENEFFEAVQTSMFLEKEAGTGVEFDYQAKGLLNAVATGGAGGATSPYPGSVDASTSTAIKWVRGYSTLTYGVEGKANIASSEYFNGSDDSFDGILSLTIANKSIDPLNGLRIVNKNDHSIVYVHNLNIPGRNYLADPLPNNVACIPQSIVSLTVPIDVLDSNNNSVAMFYAYNTAGGTIANGATGYVDTFMAMRSGSVCNVYSRLITSWDLTIRAGSVTGDVHATITTPIVKQYGVMDPVSFNVFGTYDTFKYYIMRGDVLLAVV